MAGAAKGAWHGGWPLQKFMQKSASKRVQKSKNETKRGKKRNINRKQAGEWVSGRKRYKRDGACLAWRPRMQRGVGQVQRRLKSLIIASNALAQRAPRRATKEKQKVKREESPKTKILREKMQKCATKRSEIRGRGVGGESGSMVGGAIKKRVSSSPIAGAAKCSNSSSRDTSTRCNE